MHCTGVQPGFCAGRRGVGEPLLPPSGSGSFPDANGPGFSSASQVRVKQWGHPEVPVREERQDWVGAWAAGEPRAPSPRCPTLPSAPARPHGPRSPFRPSVPETLLPGWRRLRGCPRCGSGVQGCVPGGSRGCVPRATGAGSSFSFSLASARLPRPAPLVAGVSSPLPVTTRAPRPGPASVPAPLPDRVPRPLRTTISVGVGGPPRVRLSRPGPGLARPRRTLHGGELWAGHTPQVYGTGSRARRGREGHLRARALAAPRRAPGRVHQQGAQVGRGQAGPSQSSGPKGFAQLIPGLITWRAPSPTTLGASIWSVQ